MQFRNPKQSKAAKNKSARLHHKVGLMAILNVRAVRPNTSPHHKLGKPKLKLFEPKLKLRKLKLKLARSNCKV